MNIFNVNYIQLLIKARTKWFLNFLPFGKYRNYTPFLIVGHPRTGTSLLHTYLNSHSRILSLNEALSKNTEGEILFKKYSNYIKVVGFKYFYEYVEDPEKYKTLIELVLNYKIKILKINRKNYLRTYVSLKIAEKTDKWSSTAGNELAVDKKIKLSKEECISAFNEYKSLEEKTVAILKQYKVPVLEIGYEELVTDPNQIMRNVYKFLGVKSQPPLSLLERQNPERISDLVENYSQLKSSFAGNEYEADFED